MEEVNLASALGLQSVADVVDAHWLVQLSLLAVTSEFLGSLEVGLTPYFKSYFVILDMNRLLLEKRPLSNGRDKLYTFREDVEENLELCVKSFEVVFKSCCNQRNLKSIFQLLKNVCTLGLTKKVQRYKLRLQWNSCY